MAQNLVTQVDQSGSFITGEPTIPWWKRCFCCLSSDQEHIPQAQAQAGPLLFAPQPDPGYDLLPKLASGDQRKTLVLDLDETLVHSSFRPVPNADYVLPIEIDGTVHNVYVLKRPFVDEFLNAVGQWFEVVLFTASLPKYADPVSDQLDPKRLMTHRLFREHCVFHEGTYVKDLSRLGRDINQCIIVDNAPPSYMFHPSNAVPILSWFDDPTDTALRDLVPFFEELAKADNIYPLLSQQ
eukprot:TRINITY_DN8557_c0_g3_i1.p1 TRINITY_DN8557_c0_g3~~TRINITY_DN8557_c0_g3_i1.p1  ORF type:complete len:239 (+),score=29.97 TRINITY_DN8557_c0_g3_i1:224-940(+)